MQHNILFEWVCVVNTLQTAAAIFELYARALLMCIFNEYTTHGQCNIIWYMHMALCVNGTSMFVSLALSALALLLFLMFNKDDVVNE